MDEYPKISGKVYGYEIRQPYESEVKFFKNRPEVTGMAAKDGRIILNPFSTLRPEQKSSVIMNEASRLFMRERGLIPQFEVTDMQRESFKGSEYEKDENAMKQTIVGRIISGDTSAGDITQDQIEWAKEFWKEFSKRGQ